MIPLQAAQFFTKIRLILFLIVAAAAALAGYAIAQNHYEPKIAAANEKIGALQTANEGLTAAVLKQSNAIEKMRANAEARKTAAENAQKEAQKAAQKLETRAQTILKTNPPTGLNQCESARIAFDEELNFERRTNQNQTKNTE